MDSKPKDGQGGSRRRFFQGLLTALTAFFALFALRARASDFEDDEDIEFGPLNGQGQENATKGRQEALEHGRGKGLEKAPPMSPPPPSPPPSPPPTDPPPVLRI